MHGIRFVLRGALAAALAFPAPVAAQEDPLAEFFNRRGYDREAILQQFPQDAPPPKTNNPPEETAAPSQTPQFIPLQPRPESGTARNIALILPTLAGGLKGHAAQHVHQGCLHGLRAAGRAAEVQLYAGGGGAEETVQHYRAAVKQGAQTIVGPLLKDAVRALLAHYAETPVPTLLLQPAAGKGYYVMTLDAAQEADDLARLLRGREFGAALVAEQNTPDGARQREAFERRWLALGGALPARLQILDETRDWTRLFQMLKEREEPAAVFAAGNAAHAAKARNFSPQKYPVFAVSAYQSRGNASAALSVENLHFMEMPWFAGLGEEQAAFDSPAARVLPAVRQRFFVLGADACRAAFDAPRWRKGWFMRGVGGDWELHEDGVFARGGVLAAYRGGQLRRLEE